MLGWLLSKRRSRLLENLERSRARGDDLGALQTTEHLRRCGIHTASEALKAAQVLNDWGRYGDSLSILDRLPSNVQEQRELRVFRAATLESAGMMSEALELRRALHEAFPENAVFQARYALALLHNGWLSEARSVIAAIPTVGQKPQVTSAIAKFLNADMRWAEALRMIEAANDAAPNDFVLRLMLLRQLVHIHTKLGDAGAGMRARELADRLAIPEELRKRPPLVALSLRSAIGWCDVPRVRYLLDQAASDWEHAFLHHSKAWIAHQNGDIEGAKRIWRTLRATKHIPELRRCPRDELQRVDGRPIPNNQHEIRLFTVVRNERWRLPWFVNYYRNLGVDRFVFVDNASSDDTCTYLRKQPDVHLFYTNASYAGAKSGMVWINHLVRSYATAGWILYVDVDEALVYPGVESIGLKELTRYLQRQGHDLMYAPMIDMFAGEAQNHSHAQMVDFIDAYPYFNNTYRSVSVAHCPYVRIMGGARTPLGVYENQTKTPLVRAGRDIQFLMSSHIVTPGVVSDVKGALLHFKLAGDYSDAFRRDVRANTRGVACRRRYRAYAEACDSQGSDASTFFCSDTNRYLSSRTLEDLRLIEAPQAFRDDARSL